MAGQLVMLTPIASPAVTQPPSPSSASAAAGAQPTTFSKDRPGPWEAEAAGQDGLQDAGQNAGSMVAAGAALPPARHAKWRSPPCCSGCGAAKASAGQCTGCGGRFCAACMGTPAGTSAAGSSSSSPDRSAVGAGPCSNCSSLCKGCKPVTCCFCEELRQQPGAARLCEACAGACDACQRAACGQCRAEFSSCSSCGYAACEDCTLQLQLQYGARGSAGSVGGSSLVGPDGAVSCWCAPPLRMASNVRHVSSERYRMAQLHPSFLACSMEAAGLRDADYDLDDEGGVIYDAHDEDDVIMGQMDRDPDLEGGHVSSSTSTSAPTHTHYSSSTAGQGAGNGSSSGSLLGHRLPSLGQGFAGLDAKALEAAIGSLPGRGSHLSLPLSPSGSSHSSVGHYGASLGHMLERAAHLRQPEHSLRGWLDVSH